MTVLAGGESRDPEAVLAAFVAEAEKAASDGLDGTYFSRMKKASYGGRIRALSSFAGLAAGLADADFGSDNLLDAFEMLNAVTVEDVRAFIREHLTGAERYALSVITPLAGERRAGADA